MWSTLLLPLLLLHIVQSHATLAMASNASNGLTVIEGASTTTSSSSPSTTNTNSTTSRSSSSSGGPSSNTTASNSSANLSQALNSFNRRKRHRKRNSSWYDYRNYNENNTAVEWMNPCGGSYFTPSETTSHHRAQRPKQIFNQLKRAAGTEYRELKSTQKQKEGINIDDMQVWSLHKYNYKFLPKLKPNSTIALKRWYRNMQTYVASFAYLRRVQINWDRQYMQGESAVAKELKKLLLSSKSMLCELETAVNRTYPAPLTLPLPGKQRRQLQLPQISRNDMNKRLKLRSKRRNGATAAAAAALAATTTEAASGATGTTGASIAIGGADTMDMRFVKHHYYEFLRTMWQLLRRSSKREQQQQQQQQQSPLQHQQHQLHQQKKQQQKQQKRQQRQWLQRLQETFFGFGNRKEFNEVSKPQLDVARGSVGRRGKRQQPHSAANHRRQFRRVLRT